MTQWGLDTLFNPGKRHMDDEKRRLQATREEVGDSSGGKRIDLESGAVRIARRADVDGDNESGADQQLSPAELRASRRRHKATAPAADADPAADAAPSAGPPSAGSALSGDDADSGPTGERTD